MLILITQFINSNCNCCMISTCKTDVRLLIDFIDFRFNMCNSSYVFVLLVCCIALNRFSKFTAFVADLGEVINNFQYY